MEDFDCDNVAALDPLDKNAFVRFIGGRYRAGPKGGLHAKHHLIFFLISPPSLQAFPASA